MPKYTAFQQFSRTIVRVSSLPRTVTRDNSQRIADVTTWSTFCVKYILTDSMLASLAARITVIVADVIALVVTWTHTISHVRSASSFRFSTPLCKALVRDGEFGPFMHLDADKSTH